MTLTVAVATRLGLPVSTTHGLTGALVGAGFVAAGSVHLGKLEQSFLLPLAISPVLAAAIAMLLYPLAAGARRACGLTRDTCICVGGEWVPVVAVPASRATFAASAAPVLTITVGTAAQCRERYRGGMLGATAQTGIDLAHYASAGAVSFARGLNDTPKMVALILAATTAGRSVSVPLVAALILVGGALGARRVAETMSHRITTQLSPGQGLIASGTAACLVVAASRYGLPVSTTHVTSGGLFGIGAVTRSARWSTISSIVGAWLITLPLGAAAGAAAYTLLYALGS